MKLDSNFFLGHYEGIQVGHALPQIHWRMWLPLFPPPLLSGIAKASVHFVTDDENVIVISWCLLQRPQNVHSYSLHRITRE